MAVSVAAPPVEEAMVRATRDPFEHFCRCDRFRVRVPRRRRAADPVVLVRVSPLADDDVLDLIDAVDPMAWGAGCVGSR